LVTQKSVIATREQLNFRKGKDLMIKVPECQRLDSEPRKFSYVKISI
jgi:hypothetical protein